MASEIKGVVQGRLKIRLSLARNEKTAKYRGFVARVKGGDVEFVRAAVPQFSRGIFTGGTYLLQDGWYIVREDASSWKHRRWYLTLYHCDVGAGAFKEVASVYYCDGSLEFSDETLESIYVSLGPVGEGRSRAVAALIEYARFLEEHR